MKKVGAAILALALVGLFLAARRTPRYGAGFVRMGTGPVELVVYQKPDRFPSRGLDHLDGYLERIRKARNARFIVAREDDAPGLIVRRRVGTTALSFQFQPPDPVRERRIARFFRSRNVRGRLGLWVPSGRKARPSDLEYPLPTESASQRVLVVTALRELFDIGSADGLSYDRDPPKEP